MILMLSVIWGSARTWKDTQGRSVEGEIVRVDAGSPVVQINGKELKLPLEKLSAEDQEFVAGWVASQGARPVAGQAAGGAVAGGLSLDGTPVSKDGKTALIERPYSEERRNSVRKDQIGVETGLKMGIVLPPDFDPSKPQHVFVVSTAQNNPAEIAAGNVAKLKLYAQLCSEKGWVCVAFDSNTGTPTTDGAIEAGLELLEKEWPVFKTSEYAVGGFSGGAKACAFNAGRLIKSNYKVVGAFLGGCNEDFFEDDRKRFSAPRGGYKSMKALISSGELDKIATPEKSKAVAKSLKEHGIGEVHLASHPGGHVLVGAHFSMALDWWAGGTLPKAQ